MFMLCRRSIGIWQSQLPLLPGSVRFMSAFSGDRPTPPSYHQMAESIKALDLVNNGKATIRHQHQCSVQWYWEEDSKG